MEGETDGSDVVGFRLGVEDGETLGWDTIGECVGFQEGLREG